jgi:Uma2 family endonuclease
VASSVLGSDLTAAFHRGRGGPGGWWILDEPQLHLGADVLVPDIAGWRRERMPTIDASKPYFELVPDWVCEVLSPSTALLDIARTLEVYAAREDGWRLVKSAGGDERVRAVPFDAIELELAALWLDGVP